MNNKLPVLGSTEGKMPRLKRQGKRCTRCRVWRPYKKYFPSTRSRDGYTSRCKECIKAR